MINRRKFLVQCSTAAAVAGSASTLAAVPGRHLRQVSVGSIHFSAFARLVGSPFYLYQELASIRLQLVEASPEMGYDNGHDLHSGFEPQQFGLTFKGPVHQPLEQNTYSFSHEAIGKFLLFIVPISGPGIATNARFYHASFNRVFEISA